jgi:hypothetical protein
VVELSINTLFTRSDAIRSMLTPLVRSNRIATSRRSYLGNVTFGAYSGTEPITEAVGDWRFTTFVPSIRGAYHERWTPFDEKKKRYQLERAYLHLYRRKTAPSSQEIEIVALHCDPNEPDEPDGYQGVKHARYKRGPHIHVTAADQPIPHSHLALNLSDLSEVLRSFDNLEGAFQNAIRLLEEQVLDIYRLQPPD